MTRENAKNTAEAISFKIEERQRLSLPGVNELIAQIFDEHEAQLKDKDERIKELDCRAYHAEGYISDLHNEYPKHKRFLDTKARSIVAMLFWRAKKDKRLADEENKYFTYDMALHSFILFQQAYRMLKDDK